jgi:hypothetical protein
MSFIYLRSLLKMHTTRIAYSDPFKMIHLVRKTQPKRSNGLVMIEIRQEIRRNIEVKGITLNKKIKIKKLMKRT